jgi:hypothetical protein
MTNFFRKNISLIIALGLPLLLIIGITLAILIPRAIISPKYDFVYKIIEYNYDEMKAATPESPSEPTRKVSYFYHELVANKSRSIAKEEIPNLDIIQNETSPDGFRVACGSRTEGAFLFVVTSEDCREHFLKGNGYSQKLNLSEPTYPDYYNAIEMEGWVLPKS